MANSRLNAPEQIASSRRRRGRVARARRRRPNLVSAEHQSEVAAISHSVERLGVLKRLRLLGISKYPCEAFHSVDFGFNVGLEGSPEDFSVSIGTGSYSSPQSQLKSKIRRRQAKTASRSSAGFQLSTRR